MPRIRGHIRLHRHVYRGERWYILEDRITGHNFRFSAGAHRVIGMMNGRRSVAELWQAAVEHYGDDAPTQTDIIGLLSQLHSAGVLMCDVFPDTQQLLKQEKSNRYSPVWKNLKGSFLFFRFPLVDPDRFLAATVKYLQPFYSRPFLLVIFGAVIFALQQVAANWQSLTADLADRVLTGENMVLLWLVYPIMKGLHELGHAYAVKKWGGEVHEMGIMLLVFIPLPYVDASAAAVFPGKWQRVVVGGAGIAVELFLASLAVIVWTSVEAGVLRAVAYNMLLIGGLSTLLFNGNPLIKFDGYYILADLVDIQNLGPRSMQYLRYLAERYLLGAVRPALFLCSRGERAWLAGYGLASFAYRCLLYTSIVWFVAAKYFFIGVVVALLAVFNMLLVPVGKAVHAFFVDPVLHPTKARAMALVAAGILILVFICFFLPFPYFTSAQGVSWAPEESVIRWQTSGTVSKIITFSAASVDSGAPLVEADDHSARIMKDILVSELKEYELRHQAASVTDRIEADIIEEEITILKQRLAHEQKKLDGLVAVSPEAGVFILSQEQDLVGHPIRQGDVLGYVVGKETLVRVVVHQQAVDVIRKKTKAVEVRFITDIDTVRPGKIIREIPGAVKSLPSSALGLAGGGKIATDPMDEKGLRTTENVFQFDIGVADPPERVYLGSRVYVRFSHGTAPLGLRWYRSIRQLFLKRFNV
jgi:putative peptide zinc metalloprotease protein